MIALWICLVPVWIVCVRLALALIWRRVLLDELAEAMQGEDKGE